MSHKAHFPCLPFSKNGLFAQASNTSSLPMINPHSETIHRAIMVPCRHLVMHNPSLCGPSMYCDLREQQCPARLPGISAEALNIPRAHVVEGSRTPVPYDLGAMWARPLSTGIHVSAGDRVWVDGLGEVVLIEDGGSISTDLSQFWAFFRAQTVYNGLIYVAIEWKYVELTPDEYNLRVHTISEAGRWFRLRRCVRVWLRWLFH